ncbi:NAD-dependent epimerase/dehydratase family protein [Dyella solisilvae]|uniref:NAD-dependent epimerase/dehydratase family protein n=1 Tax=Dyella solisilvae TaxID=1920168 RepID=A0A370K6J8_9GAMM|nr:NAD-dependent epimerase/dehydratase family protein [Dyella solisilvae]RDI97640.1 NAD-dependent epimerase/dehydratase family protein [Dyella solisilvae]
MSVVVFGASSQIGRFLLPRLLARGETVRALSRRAHANELGLSWVEGKLPDRVPDLGRPLVLVSFGPLLPFAQWLAATTLSPGTRVIATSSMSAETKQASDVPAERAISQALRDGEAALAAACERQGALWTIFRPTLIYGAGLDKSLTPIARRAMRLHVFPLPAGRGLRQPVHADDIAAAVVAALDHPEAAGRVLPLGGGERLTAGEMFARVQRSLPVSTLPVPVPAWVLRLGRHAVPRLRGPLTRLEANLVADNGELQRLLGVTPRPFRPDAACWTPPVV